MLGIFWPAIFLLEIFLTPIFPRRLFCGDILSGHHKEDEDVERLNDEIQTLMRDIPQRDHLFIMGDFNCKIGGLHKPFCNNICRHTLGNYNERSELLAQF